MAVAIASSNKGVGSGTTVELDANDPIGCRAKPKADRQIA
jgi:hypothetical protein